MLRRPEKILQVRVHDPLPSALNLLPNFAHGILRRSPSSISEVGFVEYRLEDRFQPIEQRLLTYPIIDSGHAQQTKLTWFPRLRDLYLPHRLRLIGVLFQLALQSI